MHYIGYRLEERRRLCYDPLWSVKPQSKRSSAMNSSRHATLTTNTHITHTPAHTRKVALGEWEPQWKVRVMSTPLTTVNLNHCGTESLQGFLCVHLRVSMCEREHAHPLLCTVYLKMCAVLFCMHVQSFLICSVSSHMHSVLGDCKGTLNIYDMCICSAIVYAHMH